MSSQHQTNALTVLRARLDSLHPVTAAWMPKDVHAHLDAIRPYLTTHIFPLIDMAEGKRPQLRRDLSIVASRIRRYLPLGASLLCLTGCLTLKPVSVLIEGEHLSHLTQHEPFTTHPTAYGVDALSVGLRWRPGPHWQVDALEGENLCKDHGNRVGGLMGPRDLFTARITYEVPLR